MTKIAMSLFSFCLFFFFVQTQACCNRLVPAIYVFGDSIVENGNNNFRVTLARANYTPYGIDFPGGATGRFSNGRTFIDFLALLLRTTVPPPIMDPNSSKVANTGGFNYASGAVGLLPNTGEKVGTPLHMQMQVELFRKTVQSYLPSLPAYHNRAAKLSQDLSKSIFIVHIGSNDYALNFINPTLNTSRQYNPEQFAELLLKELGTNLQDLYKWGARKFVVFDISPLGCLPAILDMLPVKPHTRCAEQINDLISIYNMKLGAKLKQLSSMLKGSTFITGNTYNLTREILQNPGRYGIKETRKPCCDPCMPNEIPCQDRNSYQFWDCAHPTQAIHKIFASECFSGTALCTPMNIAELVSKK